MIDLQSHNAIYSMRAWGRKVKKTHTKSINKYGEKERYRSHDHCDSEQK